MSDIGLQIFIGVIVALLSAAITSLLYFTGRQLKTLSSAIIRFQNHWQILFMMLFLSLLLDLVIYIAPYLVAVAIAIHVALLLVVWMLLRKRFSRKNCGSFPLRGAKIAQQGM